MKCLLGMCFVLIVNCTAANATTITTSLFSIEVPDQWKVEDNKASIVLAFGSKALNGMPSPFLSVQYCVNNTPSEESGQNRCNQLCNEKAINLTSNTKLQGAQFSPLEITTKEEDVTEYSSELISPSPFTALVTLSCSRHGQVYFSLVSDSPHETTKKQFADIVKSLRWK